jgi:DNA-binding NtrC family response regulator
MVDERRKAITLPIVLASTRQDDGPGLTNMLEGTLWKLVPVSNLAEAVEALHRFSAPIVLCDQEFDRRPWRQIFRALMRARKRTSVVLLSSAAGPALCDEIARVGGFDLLSRPFERDQVIATLMCAYAQGKVGWPVLSRRFSGPAISVIR